MTIDHASSLDGSPPQVEGPALGRRATDRRIIHRPAVESNPENSRLIEDAAKLKSWRLWGPYLSERQWGTVREDYSPHGDAWDYIGYQAASARAYRWGEDGIGGISDDKQRLCLAVTLWNGRDAHLKERLFGVTGTEGHHGEDVKELYWYLDALPTHAYLRMLYKYPQCAFPYEQIREEGRRRSRDEPEFSLLDLGAFDDNRYFDVFIEYAKADEYDILLRIEVHNRGTEDAILHLLPTLWFRNEWAWRPDVTKPVLSADQGTVVAEHQDLGRYILYAESPSTVVFCQNETNPRIWGTTWPGTFKDGIQNHVVHGDATAVTQSGPATKAAVWHQNVVAGGQCWTVRLRLTRGGMADPFAGFDAVFDKRKREADGFYSAIQSDLPTEDARLVQRQAFAGMIWSKQYYELDVYRWLRGDPLQPEPPAERRRGRNAGWRHLSCGDVLSMPDKWEYPWFAAWDTAFHCIPLAMVDPLFAKEQLLRLTSDDYMHPNGQIPAYEWAFGDANPPVHAWAAWRVFEMERSATGGKGDLSFLERMFHKLILNFGWWVNQKDPHGRDVFQGGFLGLDNIAVFNRSETLPTGGHLDQTDGTAWMAMYALNLMRIALELALYNDAFEEIAAKFFEHFLRIARAMTDIGERNVGLWNEEDSFYYDVLHLANGQTHDLRLRSMVGLIPLFAVETLEPDLLARLPHFAQRLDVLLTRRADLAKLVSRWDQAGVGERRLLSLMPVHRLRKVLSRLLDEGEFLSRGGIRSMSRAHAESPYVFRHQGIEISAGYEPAESETGLYGGNSNWRGPVWMPLNYLIIESLQKFHQYYGANLTMEYPTGSGEWMNLGDIAARLAARSTGLFLKSEDGIRSIYGNKRRFSQDKHFEDLILFHEFFHGDTGQGLGAAHQTGWTGLVARLLQIAK
jgi:hypothetical protein